MLPSRCVRCGAASRDFLCGSCLDYLVSYRPLWLNPALLPGPSLLELVGDPEVAIVASDLSEVEWHRPVTAPSSEDAVRLVQRLALDTGTDVTLSVGDADVLHAFLQEARRTTPADESQRAALAATYRYLSTSPWMPLHLASEYRLRANLIGRPPQAAPAPPETAPRVEVEKEPMPADVSASTGESDRALAGASVSALASAEPEGPPPDIEPSADVNVNLPAPEPLPPEPIPRPEPPLPLPEPAPEPEPEPMPEPEPEPEEPADEARLRAELEVLKRTLDKQRAEVDAWVQARTEEFRAKEGILVDREKVLESKEADVEAQTRAVTERLVALEKDAARREVLRFLGTIPGMSESEADVIATAFPDLASLRAADSKALLQCKGVTETLARAIRSELVPGELDEEQRAARLREEAQSFVEEGEYESAVDCYDRLLQERPNETGLWFDRAELLVLLDRSEEALQCYERILEVDGRNRQAWFERANLLFGLGRLADAIDALREALRIDPTKAGDIVPKAEQLRRDGHPNDAVLLFQAVLDVAPGELRAVLGLGDCFLELGDTEAAEALFTRALGRNPQNPPILFRKGELLDRKGRWGAAIQYYNRAIALQWNLAGAWLAKGKILLDHDRASEALECFDKVLSFDAAQVEAWAGKARAHAALGAPTDASAALDRASKIDASNPAVREARKAMGAKPVSPPASSKPEPSMDFPAFAKAFEEIEQESEPKTSAADLPDFQSFVESIEPEKEDAHVLMQLAELALEGGDAQMALLRYEQSIAREPRSPDAWTGKGIALQQLERFRDALEAYDRALSLKPDHELAQKWRVTCLRRLEGADE